MSDRPSLPPLDERGILISGKCPQCKATKGYAHKMSCSYGSGKGLRFYADLRELHAQGRPAPEPRPTYTPGPWGVSPSGQSREIYSAECTIALVWNQPSENAPANARLISRAPEMADLLRRQHALLVARRDEVARSLEGLALRAQLVPVDLLAPLSDHYRQLVEITAEAESLLAQVEGSN